MNTNISITLSGTVEGHMWMGGVATKEFTKTGNSIPVMLSRLCNDGDFDGGALVTECYCETTRIIRPGKAIVTGAWLNPSAKMWKDYFIQ